nr:MAG TPA: hypothetical protein [Caudoviricetes sp.]
MASSPHFIRISKPRIIRKIHKIIYTINASYSSKLIII